MQPIRRANRHWTAGIRLSAVQIFKTYLESSLPIISEEVSEIFMSKGQSTVYLFSVSVLNQFIFVV